MEKQLVTIWSDVLALEKEKISINSSFFDLGGHSLTLLQVIDKMNNIFNKEIPIQVFISAPNIKQLSSFILSAPKSSNSNEILV